MVSVRGGPGFRLAERVAAFARERSLLAPGDAVVVGVSGGPDSTCLLHVLARMDLDLSLIVAHVDHGISEGSEEVATRVARDAAAAGFDVHLARAGALAGPNLQETARDFRYSFFESLAAQEGAAAIATGHTLDDAVETTLARLVHGAGTDGLAGIRPRSGNRVHPLLLLRRQETRDYCDEVGLSFFEDPGNEDPRYERTVVRHTLVPAIEERWGDGGVRAIATSVARLAEDSDALAGQARTLFEGLAQQHEEGIRFDLATLRRLPVALRRRLLELAVGRLRDRSGGISAALEAMEREDRKPDAHFAVAEGREIVVTRTDVTVVGSEPPGSEKS